MPRSKHVLCALCLTLPLLAGCGTDPADRAASGALLGAGAGAVIGAATGGNVGTAAAIGAGAGAITGAVTDPCKLDLGDPYWRARSREEYERRCGHK